MDAETQILNNFAIYQKLLGMLGSRKEKVLDFVDKYADRISTCPAHNMSNRSTASPGGLVFHSLTTFKIAKKVVEASSLSVNAESLLLVCLLHDIGKMGDETNDYYIPQTSDWHLKQGHLYTWNPEVSKMSHPHRSLYLIQRMGIVLNNDEWIAILCQNGTSNNETSFYQGTENNLAVVLQTAIRLANASEENI